MPLPSASSQAGAVLIPVKAFDLAKGRLSDALEQPVRARLAQAMATHLVEAQCNVVVGICCDDEHVASWAESVGAHTVWCPGTDLNGAVQHGFEAARIAGYSSVAVAHSDLPLAGSLDRLLGWPGVTLVPDRHHMGSNVISLETTIDFTFSYGVGSLERHVAEAVRHRRGLRLIHDNNLAWDIDDPADLELPETNFLVELLRTEEARSKGNRA